MELPAKYKMGDTLVLFKLNPILIDIENKQNWEIKSFPLAKYIVCRTFRGNNFKNLILPLNFTIILIKRESKWYLV